MIIRKPYAFLIKYFRPIHGIMFLLFAYLVFSLRQVYVFFVDYVAGNNFMYFENMASKYVSPILFIIVVLLLAIGISIYFLMRKKDKPVLFYRLIIIYSIVLFIALVYFYFFFKSLSNTNYPPLRIVINRDISMALYYVNFLFVGFSFVRAFGFDIKKFSFDKDRKELKLEEEDNEEYEVNLKVEKDDVVHYINRQKREFKYYFKENARFYITIIVIAVVSLILYFVFDYFVINKIYHENQDVSIGRLTYNVHKSLITTIDKYGRVINEDNDFLVVYLNIKNNGNKAILDEQQFRINAGEKYYYPSIAYCDYFNDLGECYHDYEIGKNIDKEYILVYKLEKGYKKIYFEMLRSKSSGYTYTQLELSYNISNKEIVNYSRGEDFIVNENVHQVTNYEILKKTTYVYEECNNNKCTQFTKLISPKLGNQVLVVEMTNLDKLSDDFLKNYLGLKYRNKILYGSDIEILGRYQNKIYLGITNMVHKEDRISLIINARDREYNILLKEGVNE